jgi:hypothetical protein
LTALVANNSKQRTYTTRLTDTTNIGTFCAKCQKTEDISLPEMFGTPKGISALADFLAKSGALTKSGEPRKTWTAPTANLVSIDDDDDDEDYDEDHDPRGREQTAMEEDGRHIEVERRDEDEGGEE